MSHPSSNYPLSSHERTPASRRKPPALPRLLAPAPSHDGPPAGWPSGHAPDRRASSSRRLDDDQIPNSVRNAPPELRSAIKRKQNREHAKRSRNKKRSEEADMQRKLQNNADRIVMLEKHIEHLSAVLLEDDEGNAYGGGSSGSSSYPGSSGLSSRGGSSSFRGHGSSGYTPSSSSSRPREAPRSPSIKPGFYGDPF